MSSYFVAPDANEDMSLWRGEVDDDRPTPILRYCDLPHAARHLWPRIVAGVIGAEELPRNETEARAAWVSARYHDALAANPDHDAGTVLRNVERLWEHKREIGVLG